MRNNKRWLALLCPIISLLIAATAFAQVPLHQQIDKAVAAKAGGKVSPPADDTEFMRRIYLDLAGIIPASPEARQFIADKDPAKRQKLIDKLLAGDQYPRRMQEAITVMLLERRSGKTVPTKEWNEYLRKSFADNKPWSQLAGEIVAGDGRDPASHAAIKFFLAGGRTNKDQLTRDVARLFLGMDIQCAQCHDHPVVEDYKQADYFGLLAYLTSSRLQKNSKTQTPYFVETPLPKKLEFASVFKSDDKKQTGPRLPGGKEIEIPTFEKGKEFDEPAAEGDPKLPKFRPRSMLVKELASADNRHFKQNSVNRFWYLMMGRGLVHPLDFMHSKNLASHPALLKLMADEFARHKFDVKWLLREIALSQSYQRSSVLPVGAEEKDVLPQSYRSALLKPLSAEQMAWSLMRATGNLERVLAAPIEEESKFTYKDYINGRIENPPANLPDTMTLFEGVFGNPPGQAEVEFNPAMGHALYILNERQMLAWLKPQKGNLADRLSKLNETEKIAEELYLSVLTRFPVEEERAEVTEYLQENKDRRVEALGELAWALLASAEFRLNH